MLIMVVSGHVHYHVHGEAEQKRKVLSAGAAAALAGALLGVGATLASLGGWRRTQRKARAREDEGAADARPKEPEGGEDSAAAKEVAKLEAARTGAESLSREAMREAAAKAAEARRILAAAGDGDAVGDGLPTTRARWTPSLDDHLDVEALDASVQGPLEALEAEMEAHRRARDVLDSERRILLREQEALTRAMEVAQRSLDESEAHLMEASEEHAALQRRVEVARAKLLGNALPEESLAESQASAAVVAETPSYIS